MARVRPKSRPKLALVALVSLCVGSFAGLVYAANKGGVPEAMRPQLASPVVEPAAKPAAAAHPLLTLRRPR